ncbi:DnaJ (Hsp40), sub A, member 4 [Perkinsus olseni]|uniref:very-long-chain (3R)-3-hydroxyacyl-CoA dehydratase n=1 Tax=Perkinsus olseni TaxID=32597 RepID=A0A7J6UHJ9_PEROL|nr:DnaJ (Hsp40), sub A, member 4 [Perkinsus olseni]
MVEVHIEKGMKHGQRIPFRGMADENSPGVEPGDLIIVLKQKEDDSGFTRKGNDLFIRRTVTLLEALTGYTTVLTHLDDRKLIIRSKPGDIIRPIDMTSEKHFLKAIKGEGMPTHKNPFVCGNLFLILDIAFPENLSEEAMARLREVLPAPKDSPRITKKMEKEYEHHELTDMDPSVSARMGAETSGGEAYDEDEEGPRGPSVACAQQLVVYDIQFDTRAARRAGGSVDGETMKPGGTEEGVGKSKEGGPDLVYESPSVQGVLKDSEKKFYMGLGMECCGIASYTVMWAETINPGATAMLLFLLCTQLAFSVKSQSLLEYAAMVKNVTRMYAQKLPEGSSTTYGKAWRLFIETDGMKRRIDLEPRGSLPRGDAAAGRVSFDQLVRLGALEFDVDAKGAVVHDKDTLDGLAPSIFTRRGEQRYTASDSELVITQEEVETTRTIDASFVPNVRLSELTTKQLEEALAKRPGALGGQNIKAVPSRILLNKASDTLFYGGAFILGGAVLLGLFGGSTEEYLKRAEDEHNRMMSGRMMTPFPQQPQQYYGGYGAPPPPSPQQQQYYGGRAVLKRLFLAVVILVMALRVSKATRSRWSTSRQMAKPIVRYYLTLYNTVQALGWAYILYATLGSPLFTVSPKVLTAMYLFQGLAVLEVLNAAAGMVRSNLLTTVVQVFFRDQVLYLLYRCHSAGIESHGLLPMALAWSLAETIRYPYLALHMSRRAPPALTWLRYSSFLVLYPLGVYGEMRVIYDVSPVVERDHILSVAMPNAFNFSFNYAAFLKFLLFSYPLGLLLQYKHMLRQRARHLGTPARRH